MSKKRFTTQHQEQNVGLLLEHAKCLDYIDKPLNLPREYGSNFIMHAMRAESMIAFQVFNAPFDSTRFA